MKDLRSVEYSYRNFRSYADDSDSDMATFIAIGDDDVWPAKKPLYAYLVEEGEERFLLVEYPESNIHWLEPKY
jgi:hypothetical protein